MTEEKKPSKVWMFLHSPLALKITLGLVVLIFLLVFVFYIKPEQSKSEYLIKRKDAENAFLDSMLTKSYDYIKIIELSNESLRASVERADRKIIITHERIQETVNSYPNLTVPELQRVFDQRYDSLLKR